MASDAVALRERGCGGSRVPARDCVERTTRMDLVCFPGKPSAIARHQSVGTAGSAWRAGPLPIAVAVAAADGLPRQDDRFRAGRWSPLDDGLPGGRADPRLHGHFPDGWPRAAALGGSGVSHAL